MTAPNDCDFAPLLGPFHDGELPPERATAVAAHLRTCQACAAELAEIRQFSRAFRSTARPAAPPPGRWEQAVLGAARDEGLLAPGEASAQQPHLRLASTGGDRGVRGEAGGDAAVPPAARPDAEPRHLWFVRRLSAAAAVVFVIAAGQVVYHHYNGTGQPVDPTLEKRTAFPGPNDGPGRSGKSGTTTAPERQADPGDPGR